MARDPCFCRRALLPGAASSSRPRRSRSCGYGRSEPHAAGQCAGQRARGMRAFTRIAIVNRGEAAMRLIRAAREVAVEQGSPLTTIAMYTEAERNSMFVREADEAVLIRSATQDPYLDYDVLERAISQCAADAVWVGWGFVSEDPEFADRMEKMGLVFIGPSGKVMRQLGDKIGAKRLAEEAGVPVAAWSGGPVTSPAEAHRHAEAIGYPLMVKAASGGGGRGIRRVDDASGLDA